MSNNRQQVVVQLEGKHLKTAVRRADRLDDTEGGKRTCVIRQRTCCSQGKTVSDIFTQCRCCWFLSTQDDETNLKQKWVAAGRLCFSVACGLLGHMFSKAASNQRTVYIGRATDCSSTQLSPPLFFSAGHTSSLSNLTVEAA